VNNLLKIIAERWNKLSSTKKSIIIVLGIAVVLAAVFFVQWLTKVEYAPLLTDLNPTDANAIVEKLKEFGVSYRLENQGKTISVPKDQVYEVMIQLAGAGVLHNSDIGFEIFDQQRLGTTEFDNNVNFMRALQGELQRTIMAFAEIEEARVHLVLPKESLFIEEEKPASAAITLELKPLAKLRPEQVKGIIDLVSSSVANLPPENVKIIDTSGRVLSDEINLDGQSTFVHQTQYELRRAFEKDLEKRVHNLLSAIFGEGRAVVMISADLDFDQVEEETIDYGEGSVVGQETVAEESTGSSMGGPVGDPNLTPEVPGYVGVNPMDSTYQHESTTTNYLVDQIRRVTVRAPGQIRSLSASVVVNGQLTEEQLLEMERVVAAAIGFQELRGDQISVTSMTFDTGEEDTEPTQPETEQPTAPYPAYLPYLVGGLGVVLILVIAVIRRRRRMKKELAEPIIEEVVPAIPMEEVVPQLTPEEKVKKDKQQKIKEVARKKPDEVAQLIKAWLAED
jgi:flagellar M-ring protein FliF